MTDKAQTIVLSGYGPNVRFKTKGSATVQMVTSTSVRTVPLDSQVTALEFHRAA